MLPLKKKKQQIVNCEYCEQTLSTDVHLQVSNWLHKAERFWCKKHDDVSRKIPTEKVFAKCSCSPVSAGCATLELWLSPLLMCL